MDIASKSLELSYTKVKDDDVLEYYKIFNENVAEEIFYVQ